MMEETLEETMKEEMEEEGEGKKTRQRVSKYFAVTNNGNGVEVKQYETKRELNTALDDLDPKSIVQIFYGKPLTVKTQTTVRAV